MNSYRKMHRYNPTIAKIYNIFIIGKQLFFVNKRTSLRAYHNIGIYLP